MIPRLPPILLALIGGASAYGIKCLMDRLEPPAIGPPGSSEQAEKMLKYKAYARRGGIVAMGAVVAYTGYWLYDKRTHRVSPAYQSGSKEEADAFYKDQYSERERKYRQEVQKAQDEQRLREKIARERLNTEQIVMDGRIQGGMKVRADSCLCAAITDMPNQMRSYSC
ncbi:hypothetical protein BX666DRAFT_1903896 [Dichotomocladium elegans]|nr:hypothetical protein BX666DRAFT_1903896 [Dichotomocladium elegans]